MVLRDYFYKSYRHILCLSLLEVKQRKLHVIVKFSRPLVPLIQDNGKGCVRRRVVYLPPLLTFQLRLQ